MKRIISTSTHRVSASHLAAPNVHSIVNVDVVGRDAISLPAVSRCAQQHVPAFVVAAVVVLVCRDKRRRRDVWNAVGERPAFRTGERILNIHIDHQLIVIVVVCSCNFDYIYIYDIERRVVPHLCAFPCDEKL